MGLKTMGKADFKFAEESVHKVLGARKAIADNEAKLAAEPGEGEKGLTPEQKKALSTNLNKAKEELPKLEKAARNALAVLSVSTRAKVANSDKI